MKKYALIILLISFAGAFTVRTGSRCIAGPNNNNYSRDFKRSRDTFSGLKIGAKVPDFIINNILNYPKTTAKIADFKGKLLIIDFWNTWCKGCLESLPEIADLKKKQTNVQFINVTSQSPAQIAKFLEGNPFIRNLKLTMATGDIRLKGVFPYKLVPHVVWISPEGIYLGSTSPEDINITNINHILSTGHTTFKDPKNDIIQFDVDKPLFADGNGGRPEELYRSQLTKYQPGLPSQQGVSELDQKERVYAINSDLLQIYCRAYSVPAYNFPDSRIIYKDTSIKRLFRHDRASVPANDLFCYEFIYPKQAGQKAQDFMLADLDNWFGIRVTLEKRETLCYVLTVAGSLHLSSSNEVNKNNFHDKADGKKFMRGQYLQSLISYLNSSPGMRPVLDESGYTGKADLDLNSDMSDIGALNKCLSHYGLTLKEERRIFDMLVVAPAGTYNPPLNTK